MYKDFVKEFSSELFADLSNDNSDQKNELKIPAFKGVFKKKTDDIELFENIKRMKLKVT
ncbi:hypothetical protein [Flavobacterium sp. HJSW_4]|uniref:hypothetical protein n=1 Tax=Flavobacterium sp. HJSW_4 TaxID=3344660 RepID=UPI0035F319B8